MNIYYNFFLSLDGEVEIKEYDKIKVFLVTGEILTGELIDADSVGFTIERNCDSFTFDYYEVEAIEKVTE